MGTEDTGRGEGGQWTQGKTWTREDTEGRAKDKGKKWTRVHTKGRGMDYGDIGERSG